MEPSIGAPNVSTCSRCQGQEFNLMKQNLVVAAVAMLLLSAVAAGAVSASSASDHPLGPPAGSPLGNSRTNPSASQAVSFSARCTPGPAGGSINVQARVLRGSRGNTFSAVAVAPFIGGAAAVKLRRAGVSFVAVGKIPVPASQATGPINLSVTIIYGGTPTILHCISRINPVTMELGE